MFAMKHEKLVKTTSYVIIEGEVMLVCFCYWVANQIHGGEFVAYFSENTASTIANICILIGYLAFGVGVFVVGRAFYIGLSGSDSHGEDSDVS